MGTCTKGWGDNTSLKLLWFGKNVPSVLVLCGAEDDARAIKDLHVWNLVGIGKGAPAAHGAYPYVGNGRGYSPCRLISCAVERYKKVRITFKVCGAVFA